MLIKVTMKDPDTLQDAIAEAVTAELQATPGLDDDDREALFDKRQERAATVASKWFKFGEYLTVEIDTEAKTATVCPAS